MPASLPFRGAHVVLTDADPLAAITASGNHHGLIVSNMAHNVPRRVADEAMATVTGGNKLGLVMPAGGNPAEARSTDDPLHTVVGSDRLAVVTIGTTTATDSHALLTYRGREDVRRAAAPLSTVATIEQHALLGDVTEEEIAECTFRMLQPDELKLASGFTPEYVLLGNKRDQVCQVGNAVTAPAEAELVRRVIASLA